MSKLHLGVIDAAYSDPDAPGAQTTYRVAKILEKKYDVMGVFVEQHEGEIAEAVTKIYQNDLNRIIEGGRSRLGRGESPVPKIESAFSDYLARDEWQTVTGRRIAAAQAGISHRFKKPKARTGPESGDARPAFIDTDLYRSSFRAWLDKDA